MSGVQTCSRSTLGEDVVKPTEDTHMPDGDVKDPKLASIEELLVEFRK